MTTTRHAPSYQRLLVTGSDDLMTRALLRFAAGLSRPPTVGALDRGATHVSSARSTLAVLASVPDRGDHHDLHAVRAVWEQIADLAHTLTAGSRVVLVLRRRTSAGSAWGAPNIRRSRWTPPNNPGSMAVEVLTVSGSTIPLSRQVARRLQRGRRGATRAAIGARPDPSLELSGATGERTTSSSRWWARVAHLLSGLTRARRRHARE